MKDIHTFRSHEFQSNTMDPPESLSQRLAKYCLDLSLGNLSNQVVTHAKHLLLDLVGAALAGVDTPEARAACRAIKAMEPGDGVCTIWGTSQYASPASAALVNGVAAHARELDDFGGVDHSGAVVIPVLLAVAEARQPLSGKRFLEAMIVGYEVERRILDAAGGYRAHNHVDGWHSTGTWGSFTAAAACARALGLNQRQTAWTLGLAGSFTGGTWAFAESGGMSKRYHAGRAAETGVICAFLARSGFSGPTRIFEAQWGGFFETYCRASHCPDSLLRHSGEEPAILQSGIKPYAACRDIHSTLHVVLEAKQNYGLVPEDIVKVTVRCIPEMKQMVGKTTFLKTRLEAQLSLPYSVGVALVAGRAFLSEYEKPFLLNPQVRRLVERVEVIADPELPFDSEPYITIVTTDGGVVKGHVDHAIGAPQNPLTSHSIMKKFEALASRIFPMRRVQTLKEKILLSETLADMRAVTELLRI